MPITIQMLKEFKSDGKLSFTDKLVILGFKNVGRVEDNLDLLKLKGINIPESELPDFERTWLAESENHLILWADHGNTHGKFLCEATPKGLQELKQSAYKQFLLMYPYLNEKLTCPTCKTGHTIDEWNRKTQYVLDGLLDDGYTITKIQDRFKGCLFRCPNENCEDEVITGDDGILETQSDED